MFERYEKPKCATLEDWDEWERDTKNKHPVQYFFRETIRRFFSYQKFKLRRYWWAIMHRLHPKHRYNVVKPRTLSPDYHDPCELILHTTFHLLSEYAEKSLMGDGVQGTKWSHETLDDILEKEGQENFEFLMKQIENDAKVIELRNWWVIERPKRLKEIEDSLDSENSELFFELEVKLQEEENQKLKEVADIRNSLWYP